MTTEAPSAAPSQPPTQQPPVQPPTPDQPARSGFFGWVSRKPKLAFWLTGAVALFIGIGIGAASGGSSTDKKTKDELASTRAQLTRANARADQAEGKVGDLQSRVAAAEAQVKKATAHGPVPDLTGGTVSDAKDKVSSAGIDWSVKTTRAPSDADPGTVIAQTPREGTNLHSGRSITLTVAIPQPKEWRTIVSLSGAGEQRTNEFHIPAGEKARLNYSFTGESNDIIELKSAGQSDSDLGDLLFNEIGAKQGTTRLYGAGGTRYLDIQGESWSVQVQVYK